VLGLLTAFAPMSIDMYLPAFGQIGQDLRASPGAVQATLVVFFVGLALGQLFWGPLSDRLGRKRPLLAAIALYVLASLVCLLAGHIGTLIAWRALQGLSGCAGIVRDSFAPEQVARVFSRLTLVLGLAPILAPLAGGWLVQHADWRWVFGVLAGFGLLCLLGALTLPESLPVSRRLGRSKASDGSGQAAAPDLRPVGGALAGVAEDAAARRDDHPLRTYRALLRDRSYLPPAATAALTQASMFAYIIAAPTVLIGLYGVAPEHFGFYFGANALGLIAVSQLNHALLGRFGMARLLGFGVNALALASTALLLVAASGLGGLWGLLPPLFICVAALGFCAPNAVAAALAHQAQRAGSAAALLGSMQFWLAGAAGSVVAALPQHAAWPMAAVLACCAWAAWAVHRAMPATLP
jgi:DHA1 family bicyclomycin/chloramphenicol resistance-like MFS transporter